MSDEESPEAGSVAAPLAGNAVLELPDFCLLLLVGASGSGKSTLAARLFAPTEVLSSDAFRAMVSDDPDCAAATGDAFALLRDLAARRLAWRRLTVVDATNLRAVDRATFVAAARAAHAPCLALLLDVPEAVCLERNRARPDPRPAKAVKRHCAMASRAFRSLRREGFTRVLRLAEDDAVFSGDTLFRGGPGATGRSFSDFPTIISSIRDRLLVLPGPTRVLTGHGEETTIGAEAPHLDHGRRQHH